MEIVMHGEVNAKDGSCGRLTGVVIKPKTNQVTYIVFGKNERSKDQHIAPVQSIAQSSSKSIRLSMRKEDVELKTNIPEDQLLIKSDVRVRGTDGYVGHLHRLVISPNTGLISSLIVDTGGLFKKHDYIPVPTEMVDDMEVDTIHLNMSKDEFSHLKMPA